jgi:AcrR family transcriptional regulator
MSLEITESGAQEKWTGFVNGIVERWNIDSERKQVRSQRREQEIRAGALRIFARDGISRARIGDIAEEANMPTSTIYEYYASKEDLAYAVPLQHVVMFFSEYVDAVQDIENTQEKLSLYLWLAADFARRHPEWSRLFYLEIWPSVLVEDSILRHCLDDYTHIILYLIEEGEVKGEWPVSGDRYETAAILSGSLNQIIITRALYGRPKNLSRAAQSMLLRTMTLLQPYDLKEIRTTR